MYSNDFTQIRTGLVNYIGAAAKSININNPKGQKQEIVRMLCEEALNLAKDESLDMYIIKPFFQTMKNIMLIRIQEIEQYNDLRHKKAFQDMADQYRSAISFLDNLLESIK